MYTLTITTSTINKVLDTNKCASNDVMLHENIDAIHKFLNIRRSSYINGDHEWSHGIEFLYNVATGEVTATLRSISEVVTRDDILNEVFGRKDDLNFPFRGRYLKLTISKSIIEQTERKKVMLPKTILSFPFTWVTVSPTDEEVITNMLSMRLKTYGVVSKVVFHKGYIKVGIYANYGNCDVNEKVRSIIASDNFCTFVGNEKLTLH